MTKKFILAVIAALLVPAGVAEALEGPGRLLKRSNAMKLSAPTERQSFGPVPSAAKEFTVPYSGVVRVKWQARSSDLGRSVGINVDGAIDQCRDSTSDTQPQDQHCDLRVLAGDIVRVRVVGGLDSFPLPDVWDGFIRNVSLNWTVINSPGTGSVVEQGAPEALDGLGRVLLASGAVQLEADTPRSTQLQAPLKRFILPYGGTVRVKWQISSSTQGKAVEVLLLSPVDMCSDSTTSTTYRTRQCDINVVEGGPVIVSVEGVDNGGRPTATIRNVKVSYTVRDSTGTGAVLVD